MMSALFLALLVGNFSPHQTESFTILRQRRISSWTVLRSAELDELAQALQRGNESQNPLDQFKNTSKKKSWYESMDSVPFDCTECGKCCKTKGEVYMNPSETKSAATLLDLSVDDFKSKYIDRVEEFPTDIDDVGWTVLKQKKIDGITQCVFLSDNKCSLYGARPLQCSTYPFWPRYMQSVEKWNEEVVEEGGKKEWSYEEGGCEGMKQISDSPESMSGVKIEEVTSQLHMYERYKKRFPDNFVDVDQKEL